MNMVRNSFIRRPEHYGKDIAACGVIGFINHDKKLTDGSVIRKSMVNMHDRGNGLGGGFAAYGIYPDHAELYALHIMYDSRNDVPEVERYLETKLEIHKVEEIPIFEVPAVPSYPYFKRYFVLPPKERFPVVSDNDYMVGVVMHINVTIQHAFVVSSGKNMGVFKGVGFPEDIADFFRIQDYSGYIWTAHNRFPTNTPGWWGGAHPFALLDWSIVHNGEISSYGTNRRYLEMFGYQCTLQTDTEVVAYLMDLLVRRHELSFEQAAAVFAPPFWKDIDEMPQDQQNMYTQLRMIYSAAALNGPFAFLMGYSEGLIGLNDRVKLRPLVVATKDNTTYMSSEEAAIREICPQVDQLWAPRAGRPIIAKINEKPITLNVE
jgi:glutamate synthase domain-containing protein 1